MITMVNILVQMDIAIRMAVFIAIVLASYVLAKFFRSFIRRLPLPASLSSQIQRVGYWTIIFFGMLFGLSQLGVDITILLAVSGLIIAVALIAFRDTLSNLGAGYLVSISEPFKVGDWVQIGNYYGRVIEINPTHIVLAGKSRELILVPNSSIIKDIVVNYTASGELKISVPVSISRTHDLAAVEEELFKIGDKIRADLVPNSKPVIEVTNLGRDSVEVQLSFHISNPAKKEAITSIIIKEVKNILDKFEEKP